MFVLLTCLTSGNFHPRFAKSARGGREQNDHQGGKMSGSVRLKAVAVLLAVASFVSANPAQADAHDHASHEAQFGKHEHVAGECNMFPRNRLRFPIRSGVGATGISQVEFNQILDAVESTYAQEVKSRGGQLVIVRDWTNDFVNASAGRRGNQYVVHMFGGMARHPKMTKEGFLLVACHEMGHHLGESPTYTGDVLASEGQSDYYASLKCMRRVLAKFNTASSARGLASRTDPVTTQKCGRFHQKNLDGRNDAGAVCLRTHLAAETLTAILASLENEDRKQRGLPQIPMPNLNTPDRSVARKTLTDDYPSAQCRLDTYSAGAQCPVEVATALDPATPNSGVCLRPAAQLLRANANHEGSLPDALGARPACWYNQLEMENYKPTAHLGLGRLGLRR